MTISPISEFLRNIRRAALRPDEAGLTDGQLLDAYVRNREEAAFAALVHRHGPMVWGVCRRILGNDSDVEDAFQATFLVLVRKAASVVPREQIANWLYGVARQTATKARAMAVKRNTREKQVKEMPEPAIAEQDVPEELLPLLDQELGRLPDKYRTAIVLCDLEGKSYKEAARQLGCPEGTLAARLTRGRAMLAKRLARHRPSVTGGTLAAALSQSASASMPASVVSSTIKAASLIAAGQAAAAGAISVKVAALTEGVLKAMLLSKLNIAMAGLMLIALAGVGVAMSSPEAAQPIEAVKEAKGGQPHSAPNVSTEDVAKRDQQALQGVWEIVSVVQAGKHVEKIFYDGSVWVFNGNTIRGIGGGPTYILKSSQTPKEIDITYKRRISNTKYGPVVTDLGIYGLRDDELKIAMCESKYGRPKDFESTEENNIILHVFKRVRLGK
jgi:RNA polymerase sigma factor (sigma-70 family)